MTLEASHRMAFFNAIAPGSGEALSIGSLNGQVAKERAGGDIMMLLPGSLVRTFPIHGADGKPTGKRRQVDYKLVPGGASWPLAVDKVSEF